MGLYPREGGLMSVMCLPPSLKGMSRLLTFSPPLGAQGGLSSLCYSLFPKEPREASLPCYSLFPKEPGRPLLHPFHCWFVGGGPASLTPVSLLVGTQGGMLYVLHGTQGGREAYTGWEEGGYLPTMGGTLPTMVYPPHHPR